MIRTIAASILLLLLGAVPAKAQCQIATDTFNRSSLGSNWVSLPANAESFGIYNKGVGLVSGSSGNVYGQMWWSPSAGSFTDQQYSTMVIGQIPAPPITKNLIGPAVLVSPSSQSFYWAVVWQNSIYIQRLVNGVYKNLASAAYTPAVGDIISISVNSPALTVTYGPPANTATLTASDGTLASGIPGIVGQGYTPTQTIILGSSWAAGNVAPCPSGVVLSWLASAPGSSSCSTSTIITYNIYRETIDGAGNLSNFGRIAVGISATTYTDPVTPSVNQNFWYWVTAVNGCGESAQSNPASNLLTPSPAAGTGSPPTTPTITKP
jgi:hypothetical protein